MAPPQRPGQSRQDYETPRVFIEAVERRFGKLAIDLAATADNTKAPFHISPERDSLSLDWAEMRGTDNRRAASLDCWLNPPFARIGPWAAKCAASAPAFRGHGGRIFLLTPASVGAEWFAAHVYGTAWVLGLRPRLVFEGETQPYPKDCILSIFGVQPGFDLWRWRP